MSKSASIKLAPYATTPQSGGSRAHTEPIDPTRDPFEVDRHRIATCTAFRRLERKTQVFSSSYHDHFRTRLTHTLEVTFLSRRLAVALGANELLTEAITLAHDLGHPPFGHAGEAALNLAMESQGGFNHNKHSLRVVNYLEHPFPAFRGLNLTDATRAGLASHETQYDEPAESAQAHPSVESQIASLADRIAYGCHDLEDAIGAGILTATDLVGSTLWNIACSHAKVSAALDNLFAVRRAVLDAMLDYFVDVILKASDDVLLQFNSPEDVAQVNKPVVVLSDQVEVELVALERFLLERVYKHPNIAKMDAHGQTVIAELFDAYRQSPQALPERFYRRVQTQGLDRVICDYIAGMTDRFCENEHEKIAT